MSTPHTHTGITLFVYYKLPLQEHAQWVGRVRTFQDAVVQAWPGMTVELLQRPEPSAEGLETWMEVHRHPQGVSPEMMASVASLAQAHGLPPKRAAELFVPLH
jgi:hypothetical protein